MRLAAALRQLGRAQRALAHGFEHDLAIRRAARARLAFSSISDVSSERSSEPQLTPMRTGFAVGDRHLDHAAEVVVVLLAHADIARIDAVLVEQPRALGILAEQRVAVVVEVADDGHVDAAIAQAPDQLGHRGGRLARIDGDAHQLAAGGGEQRALLGGRGRVRRCRCWSWTAPRPGARRPRARRRPGTRHSSGARRGACPQSGSRA